MTPIEDCARRMVAAFDFLTDPAQREDVGRQLRQLDRREDHTYGVLGGLGMAIAFGGHFSHLWVSLAEAVESGEAGELADQLSDDPPWGEVRRALLDAQEAQDELTPADFTAGPDPRLLGP